MFSKVDVVLKTNNSLRVQVGVSCIIGIYRWGGCVLHHWYIQVGWVCQCSLVYQPF